MTVAELDKRRGKPPADAVPMVYGAIADVTAALAKDGITKSRNNAQQGYKFRGIDDVYNALAPMLVDAKLVILPKLLSREVTERVTQKGGTLFYVVVSSEFRFVSAVDGSDVIVGPFLGEAMDSGDKATNKAMSAAYKYMAMQTFCIPTEGDNDADAQTHSEIKPSFNSSQAKKADLWPAFVDKCRGFTDLDALEQWWASIKTKQFIESLPQKWQEQAAEEYEKRQEALYEQIARK